MSLTSYRKALANTRSNLRPTLSHPYPTCLKTAALSRIAETTCDWFQKLIESIKIQVELGFDQKILIVVKSFYDYNGK